MHQFTNRHLVKRNWAQVLSFHLAAREYTIQDLIQYSEIHSTFLMIC